MIHPFIETDELASLSPIVELWKFVVSRRRLGIILVVLLIVLAAAADVLSIGAVIPFLGLISNPDDAFSYELVATLATYLYITDSKELVIFVTVAFCATVFCAGLVRLFLLKTITNVSHRAGSDLSTFAYSKIISRPYEEHIQTNTSDLIGGITTKITNTVLVINSLLSFVGNLFVLLVLSATIFYINYKVALTSFVIFGVGYLIVARRTRNRLLLDGQLISVNTNGLVKLLQESIGGIRDVILDRLQAYFVAQYQRKDQPLRVATGDIIYRGGSPRYIMETVGILLMACIALYLTLYFEDPGQALPMLGAIVLAAQRMLPVMQQLYVNWSKITGYKSEVEYILGVCRSEPDRGTHGHDENLDFDRSIVMDNVCYAYPGEPEKMVLNRICLTIEKGDRLGLIGKTGSGKSTLVDVLMGLLVNINGEFLVDGRRVHGGNINSWRSLVAHVPQQIFLKDDTIAANIAFTEKPGEYDQDKLERVSRMAQLTEFIEETDRGFHFVVGERGENLSGGQRQRIGIARALYKQAPLIILDEATSALDQDTEKKIMSTIDEFPSDITVVIVTHRLTTLLGCKKVYELRDRQLAQVDINTVMEQGYHRPTTGRVSKG